MAVCSKTDSDREDREGGRKRDVAMLDEHRKRDTAKGTRVCNTVADALQAVMVPCRKAACHKACNYGEWTKRLVGMCRSRSAYCYQTEISTGRSATLDSVLALSRQISEELTPNAYEFLCFLWIGNSLISDES